MTWPSVGNQSNRDTERAVAADAAADAAEPGEEEQHQGMSWKEWQRCDRWPCLWPRPPGQGKKLPQPGSCTEC